MRAHVWRRSALLAATLLPVLAAAHHSFAMFDYAKTVTLTGTVKTFQWTSPHVTLWVLARNDPAADEQLWSVELTGPGNLARAGWDKRTLKSGDKVVVMVAPLRDGRPGGGFKQVTLVETGQVFKGSGPVAPAAP
jgi:hypothetical protein